MDARKRHTLIWKGAHPLAKVLSKLLYNYTAETCHEEGPLLVLSNHNTDMDPMLTACSFPDPLYFVASEHILRQGRVSDFVNYITEIIARQKGGSSTATIKNIVRHLKEGHSVCLYPEGNRSWDGVTGPISPATGKLVRMAGAKLVTLRMEGMYLASPRWSGFSIRRGKAHGSIAGVYDADYLKGISAKEIQEIIERDLYQDDYAAQRKNPVRFRGRKLAEHLETLLFMCPHCKTEGRMRSEGDYFICDECGTKLRYTAEGFFVGENMIYDSVVDWRIWQTQRIRELCENEEKEEIFSDSDMELYSITTGDSAQFKCKGILRLSRKGLTLPGGLFIPIGEITGMSIRGAQDLYFSRGSENYFVRSDEIRCTSKYLTACGMFDKRLLYGI